MRADDADQLGVVSVPCTIKNMVWVALDQRTGIIQREWRRKKNDVVDDGRIVGDALERRSMFEAQRSEAQSIQLNFASGPR